MKNAKTNWTARDARIDRLRVAVDNKHVERISRLEAKAAPMVGELASGKFYVYPVGGTYFESDSHTACVDRLIEHGYVK